MASGNSKNMRGFTLIELLVVIAIVAILAAMLFPVLAKAPLEAKIASVRSDLKQVGTAIQMYEDDFDGLPPFRLSCAENSEVDYFEMPKELIDMGYIGKERMLDPFNKTKSEGEEDRGRMYKYKAIGWGYSNNMITKRGMWIPADYPRSKKDLVYYRMGMDKEIYRRGSTGPERPKVKWAVWSVGPEGDPGWMTGTGLKVVDKKQWYPRKKDGIIAHFSDGRCSY